MSKVVVFAGACRRTTQIVAKKVAEKGKVSIRITSECEAVNEMARELSLVDVDRDLLGDFCDSIIAKMSTKYYLHSTCPVPIGILKAVEVETELAAPKDVIIRIEK